MTDLSQLEERVKELEEKMEYLWMFYLRFIKSIAEALPNQSSTPKVNKIMCEHPWIEVLLANRKMPHRCLLCNKVMRFSEL